MPGLKRENIQILSVQPRDYYIDLSIRFQTAKLILETLDGMPVKHVSEEANQAITEFFNKLNLVIEELERDGIGRDST